MSDISDAARICKSCRLHEGRLNAVPGEGDTRSPVVLVGEAPGRNEDESGRPFVGSSGKLLDAAFEHVGHTRSQIFITNVVKCRPPRNRRPRSDEVAICTQLFLDEQLGLLAPKVIVPMGNSALHHVFSRFLLGRAIIGEVHGKPHPVDFCWGAGVVFPIYHPAAILYNRSLEVELHADLEALVALLGSFSP